MKKPSLEQHVRYLIGDGGPQLPTDEYEQRIEDELRGMTAGELLTFISRVLEGEGIPKEVG